MSVPDEAINVTGYQLQRRDRQVIVRGRVCLYIKQPISCRLLPNLQSDDYEMLWSLLRPSRLPRGFSNIIARVAYHPLDVDCSAMRESIDVLVAQWWCMFLSPL